MENVNDPRSSVMLQREDIPVDSGLVGSLSIVPRAGDQVFSTWPLGTLGLP
jgi:hypothetical protein